MQAVVSQAWLTALVLCCVYPSLSDAAEQCSHDQSILLQVQSDVPSKVVQSAAQQRPVRAKSAIPPQLLMTGKFVTIDDLPPVAMSNLKSTLGKSPGLSLRYLNDTGCRNYLTDNFDDELVKIFDSEVHGSFRGDICRSAVLLREGGFYIDLDFELHMPIHMLIDQQTTLMTVLSSSQGDQPVILNALIAVRPNSIVMQETLTRIKKWYSGPRQGLLGPLAMAEAISKTISQSCRSGDLKDAAKPEQWSCGSEKFHFYKEENLGTSSDCQQAGKVVCPRERAESSFPFARYAVFKAGTTSKETRLIGWPRYSACSELGCGLNGGAVSFAEQSGSIGSGSHAAAEAD